MARRTEMSANRVVENTALASTSHVRDQVRGVVQLGGNQKPTQKVLKRLTNLLASDARLYHRFVLKQVHLEGAITCTPTCNLTIEKPAMTAGSSTD
jgi:hypothetical protein